MVFVCSVTVRTMLAPDQQISGILWPLPRCDVIERLSSIRQLSHCVSRTVANCSSSLCLTHRAAGSISTGVTFMEASWFDVLRKRDAPHHLLQTHVCVEAAAVAGHQQRHNMTVWQMSPLHDFRDKTVPSAKWTISSVLHLSVCLSVCLSCSLLLSNTLQSWQRSVCVCVCVCLTSLQLVMLSTPLHNNINNKKNNNNNNNFSQY